MTENEKHNKSPIKDLPVRMPGQSLRERIDFLVDEDTMPWVVTTLFTILIAIAAWCVFYFKTPIIPWTVTLITAVMIPVSAVKILRIKRKVETLRLGQIGEEAVGQFLEAKLRPAGYQVLHDIQADNFNVDHVLIGPSGVYTIETKTHSKPVKGKSLVTYDGKIVKVNGFQPDRDPVVQASAEAGWLHDFIESSTGKKFKVQPVVLYPGWYVTASVEWPTVWIMNEISFVNTVAKFKSQIDDADIHLITYHLKRYVIARDKQTKATR